MDGWMTLTYLIDFETISYTFGESVLTARILSNSAFISPCLAASYLL